MYDTILQHIIQYITIQLVDSNKLPLCKTPFPIRTLEGYGIVSTVAIPINQISHKYTLRNENPHLVHLPLKSCLNMAVRREEALCQ